MTKSCIPPGGNAMTSYIQERMAYTKEAIVNKETANLFR